jgi:phosphonate transport system substrate-binding protein
VVAVSVSSQVMQAYAERENLKYNVLWESSPYNDLPIAAHPKVPNQVVQKVQAAFASMNDDPAGKEILESVSKIINLKPPYGFKKADVNDYMEFANFYQNTLVKDLE